MIIEVSERRPYGKLIADPVNEAAKTLAKLTRRETLTADALKLAAKLGHHIKIVPAESGATTLERLAGKLNKK